jgi:hypothetical protein
MRVRARNTERLLLCQGSGFPHHKITIVNSDYMLISCFLASRLSQSISRGLISEQMSHVASTRRSCSILRCRSPSTSSSMSACVEQFWQGDWSEGRVCLRRARWPASWVFRARRRSWPIHSCCWRDILKAGLDRGRWWRVICLRRSFTNRQSTRKLRLQARFRHHSPPGITCPLAPGHADAFPHRGASRRGLSRR